MIKSLSIFLFLGSSTVLLAQNLDRKRDYTWRTGYWDRWNAPNLLELNFNPKPTELKTIYGDSQNYGQVGMISNTNGALMLFSNGCYIMDSKDSIIRNTHQMNTGIIHDLHCPPQSDGMVHPQSMLVLPTPKDTNAFVFFHSNTTLTVDYIADRLLMTQVSKDASERFRMIYVDSLLIQDSIEASHLTACRHANGSDWWILQPRENSNQYYKLLFSNNKVSIYNQSIGSTSTAFENYAGQAVFSPDGTKYVRYNFQSDVRIFDFDRCTGQLFNPIQIPIHDAADSVWAAGCAISANSRFLYVISTNHIYQFDLQASNIAASKTTVLTYDNYHDPNGWSYEFTQGQLGADGKIYVSNIGGGLSLHRIEAPDSAGMACRAVQRRFSLPVAISYALPHFPNFRLGALRGSPCDTLTTTQELSEGYELKLYPNPAEGNLRLDLSLPDFEPSNTTIEFYDLLGNRIYHAFLPPFTPIHNVDVSLFANGVYIVSLQINGKMKLAKKVTILH